MNVWARWRVPPLYPKAKFFIVSSIASLARTARYTSRLRNMYKRSNRTSAKMVVSSGINHSDVSGACTTKPSVGHTCIPVINLKEKGRGKGRKNTRQWDDRYSELAVDWKGTYVVEIRSHIVKYDTSFPRARKSGAKIFGVVFSICVRKRRYLIMRKGNTIEPFMRFVNIGRLFESSRLSSNVR